MSNMVLRDASASKKGIPDQSRERWLIGLVCSQNKNSVEKYVNQD